MHDTAGGIAVGLVPQVSVSLEALHWEIDLFLDKSPFVSPSFSLEAAT